LANGIIHVSWLINDAWLLMIFYLYKGGKRISLLGLDYLGSAIFNRKLYWPGVVGLGVVVVVVVVVVVEDGSVTASVVVLVWACLAASRSFSIEMGVVDGVGHPVNSVLALKLKIRCRIYAESDYTRGSKPRFENHSRKSLYLVWKFEYHSLLL